MIIVLYILYFYKVFFKVRLNSLEMEKKTVIIIK